MFFKGSFQVFLSNVPFKIQLVNLLLLRPTPWLVDAGVCLLMDAVILGQYAHFTVRDSRLKSTASSSLLLDDALGAGAGTGGNNGGGGGV